MRAIQWESRWGDHRSRALGIYWKIVLSYFYQKKKKDLPHILIFLYRKRGFRLWQCGTHSHGKDLSMHTPQYLKRERRGFKTLWYRSIFIPIVLVHPLFIFLLIPPACALSFPRAASSTCDVFLGTEGKSSLNTFGEKGQLPRRGHTAAQLRVGNGRPAKWPSCWDHSIPPLSFLCSLKSPVEEDLWFRVAGVNRRGFLIGFWGRFPPKLYLSLRCVAGFDPLQITSSVLPVMVFFLFCAISGVSYM